MMVLIMGVSLVIHVYSQRYMQGDQGSVRFFSQISLLLVLWSGPVYGGWVSLGGDEKVGLTIYGHTTPMSDTGQPKTVWILYDFTPVQASDTASSNWSVNLSWSVKVEREYDCANGRRRLLAIMHYSGPMGTGEVVFDNTFPRSKWVPGPPERPAP
jgi:hypothetical protein